MEWLPSYSFAISALFLAAAGLGLLGWRAFRLSRQGAQPSPNVEAYHFDNEDHAALLLLLEDRFPSFLAILSAVSQEFDVENFLSQEDFSGAFLELRDATFAGAPESTARAAMCHIVRCFLADPEVEFRCREPLSRLVDQFLTELEASEGAAA